MANPTKTCPICKKILAIEDHISFADYLCNSDDHFFGIRVNADNFVSTDIEPSYIPPHVSTVKFRITEDSKKKYIRINYENKTTEYWKIDQDRITLNMVFEPDFSSLEKIFKKVESLLLFA